MIFVFVGFSIALFVTVLYYYFWERSQAYGNSFKQQLAVDYLRYSYRWMDWVRDRKNRIYTCEIVPVKKLTFDPQLQMQARKYQATPYAVLDEVFARLKVLGLNNYKFIDCGCGMGRALIEADRAGFQKMVGLDISKELIGICNANLRNHSRAYRNTYLINKNVADYLPPDGNLVIFLFNPFSELTLQNFMGRLRLHAGSKVLVYVNPVYRHLIKSYGAKLMCHVPHTHQDFSFDIFHLTADIEKEIPFFEEITKKDGVDIPATPVHTGP